MSHWLGANDENNHNDSSMVVSLTKKEEEACIEQWKRSYTCAMETMGYLHQLCSSKKNVGTTDDIYKVASSVKQLWKHLLSSSSSSNDPRIPWCHWNYATLLTSTCTCTSTSSTFTQKWLSLSCDCIWHNNSTTNGWREDYQEALHHYLQSPWNTSTLYAIITTLKTLNDDNYNFILSHLLQSTLLSPSLVRTIPTLATNTFTTTDTDTAMESMVSTTNHNWYELTNQLTSSNDTTTIMMKFQPFLPRNIQFYIYTFLLPKNDPTNTTKELSNPNTTDEQQQQQPSSQEEEKDEETKEDKDVEMQEEKNTVRLETNEEDDTTTIQETNGKKTTETKEGEDNDNVQMQETNDKETTETKEDDTDDVKMDTKEDEEKIDTKSKNDDEKMEFTTNDKEKENNDVEMETSDKPIDTTTTTTTNEEKQSKEQDKKVSDNKKDDVESKEEVTKVKTKKTNNWIRSSKRVQSQLLSDNKQALRKSKRNSVEYCLFSILHSNPQERPQTPPSSILATKLITTWNTKRKGKNIGKQTPTEMKTHHKDDFMSYWNFCSDFGFQTNVPTIEVIRGLLLYASNHVTSMYNNTKNIQALSNNLLQLISLYSQRDGRYHSTCPGWISSSKDDSSICLLHAELRMHRYLYYQNETNNDYSNTDYYDDDDEFVLSNLVFKLLQEFSSEKETATTNKEETARSQIRTHWLAVMYYLQFLPNQQKKYVPVTKEKSVLSEGEEEEEEEEEGANVDGKDVEESNKNDQKQALKHVQSILQIFSKHNIVTIPQQYYYKKQSSSSSSSLLLEYLSYETMKEFQNELEISTILSRVRNDFQQCQTNAEYEIIYHTLRNRYDKHNNIDDEDNYEKQLELFNDFIHIHHGHLQQSLSSRNTNKGKNKPKKQQHDVNKNNDDIDNIEEDDDEDEEMKDDTTIENTISKGINKKYDNDSLYIQKWTKQLWNSIPMQSPKKKKSNWSLVSIYWICFLKQQEQDAKAGIQFLIQLLYFSYERYHDSTMAANDSSSESTTSTNDSKLYLTVIEFLMDKLYFVITSFMNQGGQLSLIDYLMDYSRSEKLKEVIQMTMDVSSSSSFTSKDESIMKQQWQEEEVITVLPNLDLLSSLISFVSTFLVQKEEHSEEDLLPFMLKLMIRQLIKMRYDFPTLLKRMKGHSNIFLPRSTRQEYCLIHANYVGKLATEIANILSIYPSTIIQNNEKEFIKMETPKFLQSLWNSTSDDQSTTARHNLLDHFAESLNWFWKYIQNSYLISFTITDQGRSHHHNMTINLIDKSVAKSILVPIGAAIVSLCTSANGTTNSRDPPKQTINDKISENDEQSLNVNKSDSFINNMDFVVLEDTSMKYTDFFDSDESVIDWGERYQEEQKKKKKKLLQTFCKSIQCIGLIFSSIGDGFLICKNKNNYLQYPHLVRNISLKKNDDDEKVNRIKKPCILTIAVVRCLTHLSDILLSGTFENSDGDRKGIWSETYPYGCRRAGTQLDCILQKAYRCLHGFSLVNASLDKNSMNDDYACPKPTLNNTTTPLNSPTPTTTTKYPTKECYFPPESSLAAAQLYRCIIRTYSGQNIHSNKKKKNRRRPPKAALECVASALPIPNPTSRDTAIRSFIFHTSNESTRITSLQDAIFFPDHEDIHHLISSDQKNDDSNDFLSSFLPDFPTWVLQNQIVRGNEIVDGDKSLSEKEMTIVRQGICSRLADGPIPRLGSVAVTMDTSMDPTMSPTMAEEREITARTEKALFHKLQAIIDSLCYDPSNAEGWFRAGLCFGIKADIIRDRLVSLNNSLKSRDFSVLPINHHQSQSNYRNSNQTVMECIHSREKNVSEQVPIKNMYPLQDLLAEQYETFQNISKDRLTWFGSNLLLYAKTEWSNFDSLVSLSNQIFEESLQISSHESNKKQNNKNGDIWRSIQNLLEMKFYSEWQEAMGGIFVYVLQCLSKRCLHTALVLVSDDDPSLSSESLYPEIAEALGTEYYNQLIGSMTYGYQMKHMCPYEKRQIAISAKKCFLRAIQFAEVAKSNNIECIVSSWQLAFMKGKCLEKIAYTLYCESFQEEQGGRKRMFETCMSEALQSYSFSLEEIKPLSDKGIFADNQMGGSSHGIQEIIYRLHASRFKVLLAAVKNKCSGREYFEHEGLQISQKYMFEESSIDINEEKSIREKVWLILADVVSAMAFCRRENSFFHRSVYRHAQALMWAPIFHDPETALGQGSLCTVPANKSYHLRGLSGESCANSAEVVMSIIFDKKRLQLCALWVTTPAVPSPFEVINDSVRKYDCLRIKYVRAYIECLMMTNRLQTLQTFLSWTTACRRDMPSFYSITARLKGGAPSNLHTRDSLIHKSPGVLWLAKYYTNRGVVYVLKQMLERLKDEFNDMLNNDNIDDHEWKKQLLIIFQNSCLSFLRLNCDIDDPLWQSCTMRNTYIPELDIFCETYIIYIYNEMRKESEVEEDNTLPLCPLENTAVTDWEKKMKILQLALGQCYELFPNLRHVSYFKRKYKKKRTLMIESEKKSTSTSSHSNTKSTKPDKNIKFNTKNEKNSTSKQKSAKSFTISLPQNVKEGDTYEVMISQKIGKESFKKILLLTVPSDDLQTLKFSVNIPNEKNLSNIRVKKRKIKNTGNDMEIKRTKVL